MCSFVIICRCVCRLMSCAFTTCLLRFVMCIGSWICALGILVWYIHVYGELCTRTFACGYTRARARVCVFVCVCACLYAFTYMYVFISLWVWYRVCACAIFFTIVMITDWWVVRLRLVCSGFPCALAAKCARLQSAFAISVCVCVCVCVNAHACVLVNLAFYVCGVLFVRLLLFSTSMWLKTLGLCVYV
jgi:hypothetical protein